MWYKVLHSKTEKQFFKGDDVSVIGKTIVPGTEAHCCNVSDSGGRGQEDHQFQARLSNLVRHCLK